MARSLRVLICFDAHAKHKRVWAVRVGAKWRTTKHVVCDVPTFTVYRGPCARQPRAYLLGYGKVTGNGTLLRIRAPRRTR